MILVDTSVWVEHLRHGHATLVRLLERGLVLAHPWVIGELALGHLRRRTEVLRPLARLPRATTATDDEVLALIESNGLHGRGIGYVDAGLLAATRLTPGTVLWTADRRLRAVADSLGVAYVPPAGRARPA